MTLNRPAKTHSDISVFLLACFSFFLFSFLPSQCFSFQASLLEKIDNGGYAYMSSYQHVRDYKGDTLFTPASTLKILTHLAALKILGPQHRFATGFYLDKKNNLYIHGGGAPALVSENISHIAQQLQILGLQKINKLILDTSLFQLEGMVHGSQNSTNPYDTGNGSLCVNFNSLSILVQENGVIISGEPQTPSLPIMQKIGRHLGTGLHRINIDAFPSTGDLPNSSRYTGELFLAFLGKHGVASSGIIEEGNIPSDAKNIYTYYSDQTVQTLVEMNLKFSNNFIANQLFLAVGIKKMGYPATWDKARQSLTAFSREEIGINKKDVYIMEGSGLSRENAITPRAMLKILLEFRPWAHLLPTRKAIKIKSGTLEGVYCYAGYFQYRNRLDPFVLLLNQKKNNRDRLFEILFEEYRVRRK